MNDAEARAAICERLDTTLVVEASAGTGKTSALVERILALIGTGGATLGQIVAVTFTDKAAGEMKLRLRDKLETRLARATGDAERTRYEHALSELETAHIATVHSFCLELLRKRPIEAGIDPAFNVIAEEDELALLDRAFDVFFARALENAPPGVRRALKRRGGDVPPSDKLRRAAHTLIGQRDFAAAWQRPTVDREREIDAMRETLLSIADLASAASKPRDYLALDLRELGARMRELDLESSQGDERDYDRLEHGLGQLKRARLWSRSGSGQWFGAGLLRADVLLRRQEAYAALEDLVARLEGELAALLREELREVVDGYTARKHEIGALDFLDLLLCTRDLLRDDPGVRAELQAAISHVFIDEFQDIDALQAEVLLTLAAAPGSEMSAMPPPGKLFVVGDPKQSIYGFRRADLAFYEQIKQQLVSAGATLLRLSRSFRANDSIQQAVNAAFSLAMPEQPDGVQAQHQALEPDRIARSEQPTVIALPVPRPYSAWGSITGGAVAESAADAVAAFIDYLVSSSGFLVEEQGAWVPVQNRHVLLLFRSMRGFGRELTRPYGRALEARGIPHVLASGRLFHAREEVMALCALLTAVEWPDDELAVYSALRGPFFALSDAALLEYRGVRPKVREEEPLAPYTLNPLARRIDASSCTAAQLEVAQALDLLREAFMLRNERPLAHTVQALLTATRAHAGMAFWPNGEQALANVQRILDEARRFDAKAATSFRAFVVRLQEQARRGEASGASVLEEGSDGVRIMTVHSAKGLEHPVVILCEPTTPLRRDPSRYVDVAKGVCAVPLCDAAPYELRVHRDALLRREQAEEIRLTYVAATRARDLLVVPCVGDARQPGWVDALHPALYPTAQTKRTPTLAPGCPAFGDDSVLEVPARAQRSKDESVAPGQHVPERGEHRVVWWDPRALVLDRTPVGGVRQQELLSPAGDSAAERTSAERYEKFEATRHATLERASTATLRTSTITALAKQAGFAAQASAQVSIESVARTADVQSFGGARFGSLMHATLAELLAAHARAHAPHAAGELNTLSALDKTLAWHGRVLGALPQELVHAATRIRAAWEHPLLARARASATLWIELPVALRIDANLLAEGAFDFAFRETDGSFTVVDLKTDDPTGNAIYAAQVALYARAIAVATGAAARGVLLAI